MDEHLPSTVAPWLTWLSSPPGQYVLDWQQAQYDELVADMFGFHAVHLALPGLRPLRQNRMPHHLTAWLPGEWTFDPSMSSQAAWDKDRQKQEAELKAQSALNQQVSELVLDSFEELPIATESVDLVVLPHVLEFAADPHQVLREVDRILRPNGRVLISGFNPVSIWGARQLISRTVPRRLRNAYLPQEGQFISVPRLKDWFKLLSFEMQPTRFGCFAPTFRQQKWLERAQFMERLGDRFWPICGAVYVVSGIKQVAGIRLIGASWKNARPKGKVLAAPAGRTMQRDNQER